MHVESVAERVEGHARAWGVAVEDTLETPSSVVAFGRCASAPVVLKVVRRPCDEWRSGEVLKAIGGSSGARVLRHAPGAALMERLGPGTPLARLSLDGRDGEATVIMADVMRRMSRPRASLEGFTTVEDWGEGFRRYAERGGAPLPSDLVERAARVHSGLCASQQTRTLLHGDLQHYNVLYDSARGWAFIDPKGVVGELEYEAGAMLRNPCERPELFASAEVVARRLAVFEARLKLDAGRALAWAFAQAVLSVVWSAEDGEEVDAAHPSLLLAEAVRPML